MDAATLIGEIHLRLHTIYGMSTIKLLKVFTDFQLEFVLFFPKIFFNWTHYRISPRTGHDRTNNYIESWHNAFAGALRSKHPNIWNFIEFIQKEQGAVESKIVQMQSGVNPPSKRICYRNLDHRLKLIVESFDGSNDDESYIIEYLESVAHNLSFANE